MRPTHHAVRRLLDTHARRQARAWLARAAVIREQLREMRGTAPFSGSAA